MESGMESENQGQNRKRVIGNYELLERLGQGTFGRVNKAKHLATGEIVAIKILEKQRIVDVSDVQRVSRQIHILKLLRHPSIIQLYEIIQTPKQLFLVMEYFSNGELFDYIVKQGRIKQPEACRLFKQFINGIEYIHKLNVVHRDLKPENLLLDFNMALKIVDFGLSSTYKKDEQLKTACGSPCYAAPEMIKTLKYTGLKVDIWSSGVILFAMICGHLPFQDPSTRKLYSKILAGDYSFPRNLNVSADCKDLVGRILTVDPDKRINIEQIRQHRWWQLSEQPAKIPPGIIVGYNRIPVDDEVIGSLATLGLDTEFVQKCIEANRHNHATTSYYLLLKKKLREGRESNADLASQRFDQRQIQPIRKNRTAAKSLQRETSKNQTRYNSFVLPKGKMASTGEPNNSREERKELKLIPQDIKIQNKNRSFQKGLEGPQFPLSTKNERLSLRKRQQSAQHKLKGGKFKDSYGASLLDKSVDRRRSINSGESKREVSRRRERSKEGNRTLLEEGAYFDPKTYTRKMVPQNSDSINVNRRNQYYYKRRGAIQK